MPRCSRHSCCPICAEIRTSMSAGRSSTRGRHMLLARSARLGHRLDYTRELVEHFVNLDFAHDQRRTEGQRVADGSEHEIMLKETQFKSFQAALADGIGLACESFRTNALPDKGRAPQGRRRKPMDAPNKYSHETIRRRAQAPS